MTFALNYDEAIHLDAEELAEGGMLDSYVRAFHFFKIGEGASRGKRSAASSFTLFSLACAF